MNPGAYLVRLGGRVPQSLCAPHNTSNELLFQRTRGALYCIACAVSYEYKLHNRIVYVISDGKRAEKLNFCLIYDQSISFAGDLVPTQRLPPADSWPRCLF